MNAIEIARQGLLEAQDATRYASYQWSRWWMTRLSNLQQWDLIAGPFHS